MCGNIFALVFWKSFDFEVICEIIVALVKPVEISTRLVLGSEACWVKSREICTQFALCFAMGLLPDT